MPVLYGSPQTHTSQNIYASFKEVLDYTMTRDGQVCPVVVLSALDSGGDTYTMLVETFDGSNDSLGERVYSTVKNPTGIEQYRIQYDESIFLPAGFRINVKVKGENSGDTGATCVGYLFDPNCASDVIGLGNELFSSYIGPNFYTLFNNGNTVSAIALENLSTFDASINAVTLADGAHGGSAASLRLGGSSTTPPLWVENSGGDAVRFKSTGGNGKGASFIAHGTGHGLYAEAPGAGSGVHAVNLGSGNAVTAAASGVGADIAANLTGNLEGNVTGSAGSVASAIQLPASADIYHADINYARDNTNTRDEYTIAWFKNGSWSALPNSGHASELRVLNRDGTQLFNTSSLTVPTDSGIATYNASGAERLAVGEAALVRVKATIDSATRTYYGIISRDS